MLGAEKNEETCFGCLENIISWKLRQPRRVAHAVPWGQRLSDIIYGSIKDVYLNARIICSKKSLQLVRNLTRIDLGILYFPELVQQILFVGTSGQQREVVEWYLGQGSPDLVDVPFGATVARFLLLKSRKKDMTILILMMIFWMRGHENLFGTPQECHPLKEIAGLRGLLRDNNGFHYPSIRPYTKTNMDTQNDGLEMVTPASIFWPLLVSMLNFSGVLYFQKNTCARV